VIGYPLAYIISREKPKNRNTMILMFIIPMWMNFLLRTYAWLTLLGRNGLVNTVLARLGLPVLDLMFNDKAVMLGMVYNFLPFMVLPIYSVLTKIDKRLLEASEDLGADVATTFKRVIFPLSIPGVITGITMVFVPAMSTFVISSLLGGNKANLIGNLIEQQFRWTGDWHFGSSMSIILMIFILITMAITSRFDKDKEEGGRLW
ncbi:MAG: ABC transporter permease, partial [Tissierellaceae bacterium]